MYRETDLINCLFGLAGWRQNVNPDYPSLVPSLIQSDSGLYFQDDHPLVTLEYLDQALKNYDRFVYAAWAIGTTYAALARVSKANKVWESLQAANIGNDPEEVGSLFWSEVSLFNEKLTHITRAAINKVVARVFTDKKIDGATKSIFENIQLFSGPGSLINKEIGLGRFVGFEIRLKNHRDITTILRRIGTQFSAANPAFELFLFHSSQEDPIATWDLNLTKVNSFEWSLLPDDNGKDWALRFLDPDLQPGGAFYLGYYESDLVGMAINRGYDFATPPSCHSCGDNYRFWSKWSQYVEITPIEVAAGDLPVAATLWNIERMSRQWSKNYGLNLDLSVRCDVTDFFCRERTLFTDVIIKQVTHDVLEHIAYSSRNNVIAKETRDSAMFELNSRKPSAVKRLDDAIKAISFDVSDLNESCLPCNDKGGISWGNV
jgi:hypothetical protein